MWGGHWIRSFKGLSPASAGVGESWELSGRPERPSRVEGDAGESTSLPDLIRDHPGSVLGEQLVRSHGRRLPLLTKFIDAEDDLSVQVHPHDAHLPQGDNGKSEAWLILDVQPGENNGFIYLGFDPAKADAYATADEFSEAFFAALNQANSVGPSDDPRVRARAERVVLPFLNKVRVRPGDVFNVRPGTIHAIGRGVRLFEIQQSSDVTYRVWDWNRPDAKEKAQGRLAFRALHIKDARGVLDFNARPAVADARASPEGGEQELVRESEGRFHLTQINLAASGHFALKTRGVFQALTVIRGAIEVNGIKVNCGRSALVPAVLPEVLLTAPHGPAAVLRATVPV
jgi:mannose-6-phosphate isomerase